MAIMESVRGASDPDNREQLTVRVLATQVSPRIVDFLDYVSTSRDSRTIVFVCPNSSQGLLATNPIALRGSTYS